MKKFLLLVYTDDSLLNGLPAGEFDAKMRTCLDHADDLRTEGKLLESQMLEHASGARSVRVRNGKRMVVDGPFTETKELLAGFNLIEAESMEEAVRMAYEFPWVETGCIEVREVRDIGGVRDRVFSQIALHARQQPGRFSTDPIHTHSRKRAAVENGAEWLLNRARLLGLHSATWAEAMMKTRPASAKPYRKEWC